MNADVPVREKIAEAILYEYPQNPDMLDRFNNKVERIEDIFDEKRSGILHGVKNFLTLGNQRATEVDYLKTMIESLICNMLEQRQAECYEDGMVSELSQKLTASLELFNTEKQKLTAKQKLKIHVWTLQQFCKLPGTKRTNRGQY